MPLQTCKNDAGLSGYQWGETGTCHTYETGNKDARAAAKKLAVRDGFKGADGDDAPALTFDHLDFSADEVRALLDLEDDAPVDAGEYVLSAEHVALLSELGVEDADRLFVKGDDGELPTIDLVGVEILAAGGPYFGQGSPKEGDHFDVPFLKKLAANAKALAAEVRPPNKVGHSKKQTLLKNSGLTVDDEQPAAGWLTNFRVKDGKLLADIKGVPAKLGRLIKAGAFRTRSVELRTIVAQSGASKGKKLTVVSGLAWLGAVAPAVRTLDDIVKLYSADDLTAADLLASDEPLDAEDTVEVRTIDLADAGAVVWKAEAGLEFLRAKIRKALNPGPSDYRYWVRDVAPEQALVQEGDTTWVVPYSMESGEVTLSPSSDWTEAAEAWVALTADDVRELVRQGIALSELSGAAGLVDEVTRVLTDAADTSSGMPDTKPKTTFTDEQIVAFALALGIEETDEAKRREAVEAKLEEGRETEETPATETEETTTPATETEPATTGLSAAERAEFELLKTKAERGDRAYADLQTQRIETELEKALTECRIEPARREFWQSALEEDFDGAVAFLSEMPVRPELKGVYGSDIDPLSPEGDAATGDKTYAAVADALGIENPASLQKVTA